MALRHYLDGVADDAHGAHATRQLDHPRPQPFRSAHRNDSALDDAAAICRARGIRLGRHLEVVSGAAHGQFAVTREGERGGADAYADGGDAGIGAVLWRRGAPSPG